MNLDQVLQVFLAEARELLQDMEDRLLHLERHPDDPEALNALFRAAHTIKGSAGMFQLDDIVGFTHVLENLLDLIRSGKLELTRQRAALFLACADHIGGLLDRVGSEGLDAPMAAQQESLLSRLKAQLGQPESLEESAPPAPPETAPAEPGGSEHWHLSVRFDPDVMRQGMDPVSFVRYLQDFGEIVGLSSLWDSMPAAGEMDPETCYLGLEIELASQATKEALESVFDFIRDGSLIRILPPRSRVEDYLALIQELPEDERKLGEILVSCGALTRKELDDGLRIQQDQDSATPLGSILVAEQLVPKPLVEAALDKQHQNREAKVRESKTIRVDAEKLDRLINLIGELVIAGAGVNLMAQRSGLPDVQEAANMVSRLVEEVRDSALTLRMVQIGDTFNRFQRLVRDVSHELGKEIDLHISGGETELDKTVVEKISDPLVHLIRNAIDHGIEQAEARLAKGKPAKGTLLLHAFHDSGSIVIEVRDDGGGLNRDRILAKAIERGIASPNHSLSDQEIYQLIFEPGFSTAEQVTNLSGRGVGMDVVKRNITALRGTIELDSAEGRGTCFRIRLPLTLAIIDGFLVEVGAASFVIPLDMVVECVDLATTGPQDGHQPRYLNLRGEVLPYVRLRETFALEGGSNARENVVVVQYGDQRAGLVVDQLMGEFQTVIKPLGPIFSNLKGIAGSTILGSGEVALILDVPALIRRAVEHEERSLSK